MIDHSQLSALESDRWQHGTMWSKIKFALHPTLQTSKESIASSYCLNNVESLRIMDTHRSEELRRRVKSSGQKNEFIERLAYIQHNRWHCSQQWEIAFLFFLSVSLSTCLSIYPYIMSANLSAYPHTYTHTDKQTYMIHARTHTPYIRTYIYTYIHMYARRQTHTHKYTCTSISLCFHFCLDSY